MPAEEEFLGQLLRTDLTWNTPLSDAHADRLLGHFELPAARRILDLGCGRGRLLLQALARAPGARGVGVDLDRWELDQGRVAAKENGLEDRVTFVAHDAAKFDTTGDRVLCIGAAHAWGGTESALTRLRPRTVPKGLLLFGGGFWVRPPPKRWADAFGSLPNSLENLESIAVSKGWKVVQSDTADQEEWDQFEEASYRGLERFAKRAPDHPLSGSARTYAEKRRKDYYSGYRGLLGFAYLILR